MQTYEYAAPKTLKEAKEILASFEGSIRALAGGTDLIDQLKVDRRQADLVLDVKNIPELNRLEYLSDGLHLGAGVSCTSARKFPAIVENYPALAESSGLIGSVQIQNRAAIGGNVCNAAPSADTVPALLIYDARVSIVGPRGRRELPLEEFFAGPGATVLQPDEILVEIVVPPPPSNSASHYLRFIPREEMDIAVAGVGSLIAIDPKDGRCSMARIGLAAVSPTPTRARDAEAVLEGNKIDEALIREAGERAVNHCNPINDVRGTIEYRKELVKVLTRRTLARCLEILNK